jgi:hypothetical protein
LAAVNAVERRRLERRRDQLYLAGDDMWQAEAGLDLLERTDVSWGEPPTAAMYARMTIWAGIVVTYCRAFTGSRYYERLGAEFIPDVARLADLHRLMIEIRHQFIAHTDSPERSGRPSTRGRALSRSVPATPRTRTGPRPTSAS